MAMFKHPSFRAYDITKLPLGRDIFMMDEVYMDEWEAENIKRLEEDDNVDPYGVGCAGSLNSMQLKRGYIPRHQIAVHRRAGSPSCRRHGRGAAERMEGCRAAATRTSILRT